MRLGKIEVKLVEGDLTEQDVDAIVNAANNHLKMGGGVAGAIRRKGGAEIQKECDEIGPIEIGGAAVTGAGKLKARYVIHAATMGMDFRTNSEIIRAATRSTLKQAAKLGIKSLAFPALGCGVGGFPPKECAKILLEEIRDHAKGNTSLQEVRLVLYGKPTYNAFKEVYDSFQPGT